MLPARIIRCYRSKYLFTPAMVENERRLKKLHPSWEFMFFNHYEAREWVASQMPEWLEIYNFYPVDRQREQVFRWLALWKIGGFCINVQFLPLKCFGPLLERSLILAEHHQLSHSEFECLHRIPVPSDLPELGMTRITSNAFAAEAGNRFVAKVLETFIARAGYLDSSEPTPEDEDYTTGTGAVNAAWLEFLNEGILPEGSLLQAPKVCLQASSDENSGRVSQPCCFGKFGYEYTDLNN